MRWWAPWVWAILSFGLCACPPGGGGVTSKPEAPAPFEDHLVESLRFQLPSDWDLQGQDTTDPDAKIYGGLSLNNQCFVLVLSIKNADLLPDSDLLKIAQEKLFSQSPASVQPVTYRTLSGLRAEMLGQLGNNSIRAYVFVGHWQSAGYIFIVASKEIYFEANKELLEKIIGSLGV